MPTFVLHILQSKESEPFGPKKWNKGFWWYFWHAQVSKQDLKLIKTSYIPLIMVIYSLSLFVIVTKDSSTTEKRLNINLKKVQDSYNNSEVQDIAYTRSEHIIADALTKVKKESFPSESIEKSPLDHLIQQYIIRSIGSDSGVEKLEC